MRTFAFLFRAGLMLAWFEAVSPEVAAQSESGSAALSGVATDNTNAVVPGLLVTARHLDTGAVRTAVTDTTGRFLLLAMPVGPYGVEAVLSGFATVLYERVVLTVGSTTSLDISLTAAGVTENVTVTAEGRTLDRTGTAIGTVIAQRSITDLPIRGRNFAEFAQLSPMVLQEGDRGGLVIAGQRSINSNVAIDGADFTDPQQGNQRGGNETAFFFPQSAVREFQVVRSGLGAEVGRTGGGFINVVTRSGTNVWQGDAFYYNRNRTLTSADAFDRKHHNLAQNQFGGSLGGALVPNRVFVFGAAEQNLLRVPFTVAFQRQAAGVVVPAELRALEGEQVGTNNPTAFFGRLDALLTPKHTLNVQGTYTHLKGENFNFDSPTLDIAASANYAREASSVSVKGSLTSAGRSFLSDLRVQGATDNRLENPNSNDPQITIVGFGTFGGDNARPRQNDASRFQAMQNLSWTGTRHEVKFGWDLNVTHFRTRREFFIQGQYDFASLADYQAGRITRYRQTVARNDPSDLLYEATGQELALFVQDRLELGSRLTLTAGLRWEGQWNPDPPNPNPLFPETSVIPDDLRMWQPRLGLTWDTRGNGRTIVRTSAGLYASRTPSVLFARVATDNGLTTTVIDSRFDPSILSKLPFPGALTVLPPDAAITFPQPVLGFHPDFQNPRTFQGSASVDHQLGNAMQVTVGYTHASTWHLQRRLDHNLFPPTLNQFGLPIYPATRPNPAFARISFNESTARARYEALSLSLTRQVTTRFQAAAHYTLAYNKDHDSNERTTNQEPALNVFDTEADWSWSKQDVRHNFNASTTVDLPGGFTAGAILFTRSGFPFTPTIGTDQQRDGNELNDRAIINGRVTRRNSMRQPHFFSLDLRLIKAFRLDGRYRVDLVADALNVTRASNKNFGVDATSVYGTPANPVATAGQPLFAPSTARFGGPRQLQLGLRMSF